MDNIQIGLWMLMVGMPTVFFVLFLVIALGKFLILMTNKYAQEDSLVKEKNRNHVPKEIPHNTVSAIVSAVSAVTGGKGRVEKIEKIEDL